MTVTARAWTRRQFTAGALLSGCAWRVSAQGTPLSHASVLGLEHRRILDEDGPRALAAPVRTLDGTKPPPSAGAAGSHDFVSEAEPDPHTAGERPSATLFVMHATLLREFSRNVAHLTAAFVEGRDPKYAAKAGEHLRAWLVSPATRMSPEARLAGLRPGETKTSPAGIVDLLPLAEVARACSFLIGPPGDEASEALTADEWTAVRAWFAALLAWMDEDRQMNVARDTKDHRASAWLLVAGAVSRFVRDEATLEAVRKRFRAPTLRNQIHSDGSFPSEVVTPNPYRNSLFNFDLLSAACQVLQSPFDPLWTYQLIDGVGMRSCAAFLYPLIEHPERWPFLADAHDFRLLPGRRVGLLFAGRAFNRPEYLELWQATPPGPVPSQLAYSYPVSEPGLWTARAPHGL